MTTSIDTNYTSNILSQLDALKSVSGTSGANKASGTTAPTVPPADKTTGESQETPVLPQGNQKYLETLLKNTTAVASMGAAVLALTQELNDDLRRANNEKRYQQQSTIIEGMKDTAEQMRSNATKVLITACVAAGIQVVAGALSVAGGAKSVKMEDAMARATQMKWSGISQMVGQGASVATATQEYLNTIGQAKIKEMEADTEKQKQMLEVFNSLNDSLKEVISKANQAMSAIQQTENSTRTKIQS